VAISGTGFGEGAAVFFGGAPAQSALPESGTEIIAASPPERPGQDTVNVTVSCKGTVSPVVPADMFSYIPAASPSVSVTSPSPATPAASGRVGR
jgi:hypothetical protein